MMATHAGIPGFIKNRADINGWRINDFYESFDLFVKSLFSGYMLFDLIKHL